MLDSQAYCRLPHVVIVVDTFNSYRSNPVHGLQRNSYAEYYRGAVNCVMLG